MELYMTGKKWYSKKDTGIWNIQQNPVSGILKLRTIFKMTLHEFLFLSQMKGIVGFSESQCLNSN